MPSYSHNYITPEIKCNNILINKLLINSYTNSNSETNRFHYYCYNSEINTCIKSRQIYLDFISKNIQLLFSRRCCNHY